MIKTKLKMGDLIMFLKIKTRKLAILLIFILVAILGSIYLISSSYHFPKFEIIYNTETVLNGFNYETNICDAIEFIKILVTEYNTIITDSVDDKFINEIQLLKMGSISAKVVISTFGESLIYLFPSNEGKIFLDVINYPAQKALSYGFIDLDNPENKIDLHEIKLHHPLSIAKHLYEYEPGNIGVGDYSYLKKGWILFDRSLGKVIFRDGKMFFFMGKEIIAGIACPIAFQCKSPKYIETRGKEGYYGFKIPGLLLISNVNTFDWADSVAKKLGDDLADTDIKALFTNSEFFRLSLADDKLKPIAEDISEKQSRSLKDENFEYPQWEFMKDFSGLKGEAKKLGIDVSYVDELYKHVSLKKHDGILFFYYNDSKSYMWQWTLMNIIFLMIFIALTFIKLKNTSLLIYAAKYSSKVLANSGIITLIISANVYVFYNRPESLTLMYWIIPFILGLLSIIWIVVVMEKKSEQSNT